MKVNINKFMFEIIEEDDGEHVWLEEDENGMTQAGVCYFFKEKIYIHKNLSYKMKKHVLAHELTHAFLFAHGLYDENINDEIICEFVANYHERITEIVKFYFKKGE